MKYTVSFKTKFGTVSAESNYPDDLIVGYESLKQLAAKLESSSRSAAGTRRKIVRQRNIHGRQAKRDSNSGSASQNISRGRGETAKIIREIESSLLSSSFFSKPKSTGETKEKLDESTGGDHTSRKVSQALGILWKKRVLKRSGTRNYFVYSR